MILHFININRSILSKILLVLLGSILCGYVFSAQNNSFMLPDKSGYITWKCKNRNCLILLKRKNNEQEVLFEYKDPPSIVNLGDNLISLYFSCGSPCNYTAFYDSNYGLSKLFEFVIAINIKRKVVLVAETNQLVAYNLFDKAQRPIYRIRRDWSNTATLYNIILNAKFVKNDIYIKYLAGNDYKEKIELIPDPQKIS